MLMPGPGLPSFDYIRPESLAEASRILAERAGKALPYMGGTDLIPKMRDGVVCPDALVDVKGLPGMDAILFDLSESQNGLTIGAAVTMNRIAQHPVVRAKYPPLAEAAGSVGSYQVRNRATIGGNLCNASPCADVSLAALVLDGRVVVHGPLDGPGSERTGNREIPVAGFFLGPGETALLPGEFVTAIRFPAPLVGAVGRHLKIGRNRLGDLALVGVEVLGFSADATSGAGPSGTTATRGRYAFRVGLGAVAATVVRAMRAEALLASRPPGEEAFVLAAELAAETAAPIDDVRAGATYRAAMVRNLTLRGLRDVWEALRAAVPVDREG